MGNGRAASTTNGSAKPRIGLVGDDLSGVAAVAGAFAAHGFKCRLEMSMAGAGSLAGNDNQPDLIALMTESRHGSAEAAADKVRQAVERLRAAGCDIIFKKVDSLLRGPVGPELAAIARAFPGQPMMVATAAPGNGRITRHGVQLKLDAFSTGEKDDGSFIRTKPAVDHIPSLLAGSIEREIVSVPVEQLAKPDLLATIFADDGEPIFVCDAEKQEHLRILAAAAIKAGIRVYAGTSDLASAVAAVLTDDGATASNATVLVVAGSASSTVRVQLAELEQKGLGEVIWLPAREPRPEELEKLAEAAIEKARHYPAIVIASRVPTGRVTPLAAARTEDALAAVAIDIAGRLPLAGIVATGGDTATALVRALGVEALEPRTLLESGIPLSTIRGGPHDGMALITKPGAHGGPGCLGYLVGILRMLQTSGRLEKVFAK